MPRICPDRTLEDYACCFSPPLKSFWSDDWSKEDREVWGSSWLGECATWNFFVRRRRRKGKKICISFFFFSQAAQKQVAGLLVGQHAVQIYYNRGSRGIKVGWQPLHALRAQLFSFFFCHLLTDPKWLQRGPEQGRLGRAGGGGRGRARRRGGRGGGQDLSLLLLLPASGRQPDQLLLRVILSQ